MILFSILALIIFFSAKRVEWVSVWYNKTISQPFNYRILLGLLVFGFLLKLDYTNRFGCLVGGESIFDPKNILFSSISVSLILSSYLLNNRFLKLSLVTVELLFWIFKLFYFKGGYVVSFGGIPDPAISFFDTLTLSLRLFIIIKLLQVDFKTIYLILITLIIMSIKIFAYPIPMTMIIEDQESLKRSEITIQKLQGTWTGIYEYDSISINDPVHIIDTSTIIFRDKLINIFDFKGVDSIQLNCQFEYEFGGSINDGKKNNWDNYYDFWISSITDDSLNIDLTQTLDYYRFKLIKNNPK